MVNVLFNIKPVDKTIAVKYPHFLNHSLMVSAEITLLNHGPMMSAEITFCRSRPLKWRLVVVISIRVYDELARWKGQEARKCGHVQVVASMVFTPGTTVESGPTFTNG
jgi:hypothetical protein